MFWFQVKFGTRDSAQKTPTPVMVPSKKLHADLWHKRLLRHESQQGGVIPQNETTAEWTARAAFQTATSTTSTVESRESAPQAPYAR